MIACIIINKSYWTYLIFNIYLRNLLYVIDFNDSFILMFYSLSKNKLPAFYNITRCTLNLIRQVKNYVMTAC